MIRIRPLISLLLILVPGLCLNSWAQVSGYQGKRFMLKSDLSSTILEQGYSVEIEALLLRDFGISVDYSQRSIKDYIQANDSRDTISFINNTIGVKFKSYLNKAIPAPLGAYGIFLVRLGTSQIDVRQSEFVGAPFTGQDQLLKYEVYRVENALFFQIGAGWGYQTVLFDRLVLDAGWTVVASTTEANQTEVSFNPNINGANLLNPTTQLDWPTDMGINMHLSVGVLLF